MAKIPVFGLAYKTGVKNFRNIKRIEMIFPISLITPFNREVKKPKPNVNKRSGIINIGKSKLIILGVFPYPINNMHINIIWIMRGMIALPIEAITRDFFEKLILRIIEPAFTSEFEQAIRPLEKNCQKVMPISA